MKRAMDTGLNTVGGNDQHLNINIQDNECGEGEVAHDDQEDQIETDENHDENGCDEEIPKSQVQDPATKSQFSS